MILVTLKLGMKVNVKPCHHMSSF